MNRHFSPRRVKSTLAKLPLACGLTIAHVLPFTLAFTGTRKRDWLAFFVFYCVTTQVVSLSLHRYFAHRSFRTSRLFQFFLALLACCLFGDPVWFAGKHRLHHKNADADSDVHTPLQGLWHCWMGSILDNGHDPEEIWNHAIDWRRFPELRFLSRFFYLPGFTLVAIVLAVGGYRMFVVGYCLTFLVALHGASAVNFFCHRFGYRCFATPDLSTNNLLLGYLFFGEGWHNNHHRYPSSAKFSHAWYEIDLTYVAIRILSALGLVWDVHTMPQSVTNGKRSVLGVRSEEARCAR